MLFFTLNTLFEVDSETLNIQSGSYEKLELSE